jgi:hypothetical protein
MQYIGSTADRKPVAVDLRREAISAQIICRDPCRPR